LYIRSARRRGEFPWRRQSARRGHHVHRHWHGGSGNHRSDL